jgi:hypothetical protein
VAEPVKLTARGTVPEVGVAEAVATRDAAPLTVMVTEDLAEAPLLSVTTSEAVKVPEIE